jgi:hypothetical protein
MSERRKSHKRIAPGILVSADVKVEIPHPTECFILRNEEGTASIHFEGSLGVFSSEENAKTYIQNTALGGAVITPYKWHQLVEDFGGRFGECLIDHTGEAAFYSTVPLRKDI